MASLQNASDGDPEQQLVAYRVIALIAVHHRLPLGYRESLGARIHADPELEAFRHPYLLAQPHLPPVAR